MALKAFFNLLIALLLFSCSFEPKDKINYEAEFYSIVKEFEESSILNFDREDIDNKIFVEQFLLKLDKQKNIFVQEDFNQFKQNIKNQPALNLSLIHI